MIQILLNTINVKKVNLNLRSITEVGHPTFLRQYRSLICLVSSISHHLGDDLALDRTVFEVLAVEVLRSVAHAVAGVANDRQLHFVLVGDTQRLYV